MPIVNNWQSLTISQPPANQIAETNDAIRSLTNKPSYAINLWVSDRDERLKTFKEAEFEKLKSIFKPYFDQLNITLPEIPTDLGAKFESEFTNFSVLQNCNPYQ